MSALEQWAIWLGIFAAVGLVRLARALRAQPKREPPSVGDADELEYLAWRRERENPPRGRASNDVFPGEEFGESWGIVVAIGLLWLIFRAC